MITNTGKGILAKYLLGQAPAFASYIAVGCGPQALTSGSAFTTLQKSEYSAKNSLDFEMFRVPIISRGYVNEGDLVKLVLTAELPTEERYEITEIGVYSAGANPSAGAFDSRAVYSFTQNEGWEYHTQTGVTEIPSVYTPLDRYVPGQDDFDVNVIAGEYIIDGSEKETPVFHTNADNRIFTDSNRIERNERCRALNNMTVISGADSELTIDQQGNLSPVSGSNHIHITNAAFNFNRNAPTDELRLAFSVINKDGFSQVQPDEVRILIQFAESETLTGAQSASFSINLTSEDVEFEDNRYFVVSKQLQELLYTSAFNWDLVSIVKIYASVIKDDEPSPDYYVCLDAMRIENVSSVNPLYGLTGYSVIKTDGARPIVKGPNTSNFIEFRISLGVQ
jgi:hypothetical protein